MHVPVCVFVSSVCMYVVFSCVFCVQVYVHFVCVCVCARIMPLGVYYMSSVLV